MCVCVCVCVCVCMHTCTHSFSVMSDSLQPHGLKSARLLCRWGFFRQEYWSTLPCPPPGIVPGNSVGENSACNAGDPGSIPGWGRYPGEVNGNPLQYSCLENPLDKEPGRLQSMGLPRVGHGLATKPPTYLYIHTYIHICMLLFSHSVMSNSL